MICFAANHPDRRSFSQSAFGLRHFMFSHTNTKVSRYNRNISSTTYYALLTQILNNWWTAFSHKDPSLYLSDLLWLVRVSNTGSKWYPECDISIQYFLIKRNKWVGDDALAFFYTLAVVFYFKDKQAVKRTYIGCKINTGR